MDCFDCGNCKLNEATYYCPAKNDFVIKEQYSLIQEEKMCQGWKKGTPEYEKHRRKVRQNEAEKIVKK